MGEGELAAHRRSRAARPGLCITAPARPHLPPQDELLDVLHWWKQAVAISIGSACGLSPVTNLGGLLAFFVVMLIATLIFYRTVLK